MHLWTVAATILAVAMIPCAAGVFFRHSLTSRLVALKLASTLTTLAFVCLAAAGQTPLFDVALAAAVVSYPGSLVLVKLLAREM